jgi:hypothetical protein
LLQCRSFHFAERRKRPPASLPTGVPDCCSLSYLQCGHVAQSQQVQLAHPHTPVLQQLQQGPADVAATVVACGATMAVTAIAISRSVFMMNILSFKVS